MPELPEVETFARYFARHALHQRIERVRVLDERILGEIRKASFVRRLAGHEFVSVLRHGKHLFADAGGLWLHLHFGMSGDLTYSQNGEIPRFSRVVFELEKGATLAFEDMRLFGVADLVDDPDAFIEERGLGPDPLSRAFTSGRFAALLSGRRGAIKSLLMNQEILAGLGNLYVDEALFQTGVHPRRAVDQLTDPEVRELFVTIRRILRDTIARHARDAAHPGSFLIHHREEGELCPRCGGTIRRSVVFGRTTYFCAKHQR